MSVNDEAKNLEEEVVVNETTDLVEVNETKKAEKAATVKKVLKIAGVVGVGVLGFILGAKAGSKSEYDDSEMIVVENDSDVD